jgi:hypothetical protein
LPAGKQKEKPEINVEAIELRTELADVKGMLNNILKNQTQGGLAPSDAPEARGAVTWGESAESRVERETNDSTVHRSQQQAIRSQRVAGSYMDALIGVTEEHSDFNDAKALSVIDLGSRQDNMIKLADQLGKHPRGEWIMKHMTTLAIIASVTIVAVAMLQPPVLEIIARSLGNPRNEFIMAGLIGVGVFVVVYERVSKQRAMKKAVMQ